MESSSESESIGSVQRRFGLHGRSIVKGLIFNDGEQCAYREKERVQGVVGRRKRWRLNLWRRLNLMTLAVSPNHFTGRAKFES